MKKRFLSIALTLAMVSSMAVGCGSSKSDSADSKKEEGAKTEASADTESNQILFNGSSTLAPVITSIATDFFDTYGTWDAYDSSLPKEDIAIYVSAGGSGQGTKAVIDGTATFGMVARSVKDEEKEAAGIVEVPENMVIAYVDGSFEKSIGRYAFGCVILTPAGEEFRKSGSGCDPEGVKIRNVAGEMLGAMNAVQWAKEHEYPAVEIRYDYEGVEKWVTGVWRAKTPLTSKYAAHMQKAAEQIKISFCKVAAHTGNHYNEEADQLAKSALLRTDENVSI